MERRIIILFFYRNVSLSLSLSLLLFVITVLLWLSHSLFLMLIFRFIDEWFFGLQIYFVVGNFFSYYRFMKDIMLYDDGGDLNECSDGGIFALQR